VSCAAPDQAALPPQGDDAVSASALTTRPPLGKSLVIEGDTRLKAGEHYLPALGAEGERGVVLLEGLRGVRLELEDVVLRGQPLDARPDQSEGYGLVLRNCEDVHITGGEVRGYRVGILVDASRDIVIEGLVVSSGYARELSSTRAASDPLDRLVSSNEGDRWLREYGAGVFIQDSSRVTLRDCRVRSSQNGVCLVRSSECLVERSDFSYLSGWGIALERSESNTLRDNRCDFVARLSSSALGDEGFGAAGLLLAAGCSGNELVGNSAVRCGAGAVLRGEEGGELSDNRLARNDFSMASWRSVFIAHATDTWLCDNELLGGAGGGFELQSATRSVVSGNRVERVFGAGIALRSCVDSSVSRNVLRDCDQGLLVSESAGLELSGNTFEEDLQELVLEESTGLALCENDYSEPEPDVLLEGLEGLGQPGKTERSAWATLADAQGDLPSGRARHADFVAPSAEPTLELTSARSWAGRCEARGTGLDAGELLLGPFTPWDPASLELPPRGGAGLGLFSSVTWDATWFAWNEECDPRGDVERWRGLRYEPLARARVMGWTDPWGGSTRVRGDVGGTRFGLVAASEVYITRAGTYLLGTLSDDGLRVFVDGEPVHEDWTWHPAQRRTTELELSVGRHELALEYFQIDGAAELTLELDRAPE
jgi:parallel beta-helix repeat protein